MWRLFNEYYSPRVAFPDNVSSFPMGFITLELFSQTPQRQTEGFVPLEWSSWTYSSLLERNEFYLSNQLSLGRKMIDRYIRGNADAFAYLICPGKVG